MRVLFAHRSIVGHFMHLAPALAASGHEVAFLAAEADGTLPGVRVVSFRPTRAPAATTHHYLQPLERAVLLGQAAYRAARDLAAEGFRPDVVVAHAGFGPGLYLRDAFPHAPSLGWFEWYYAARGTDADFLDARTVGPDDELRIRTLNGGILLELAACTRAAAPTKWQRDRFPEPLRGKLEVLHEGIDTSFFAPGPATDDLGLPAGVEVVTYVARGLEPYRGFPAFVEAVELLQRRRPRLWAIVVGSERTWYGPTPPDGRSWRELALDACPGLDHSRLLVLPFLPQLRMREVLRRSDVHVYLTVPFVLSWSVLEAMAAGCALVASDTPPVREVVEDGATGLLADMRSPASIADAVERLLEDRTANARLRVAARSLIKECYALPRQLARQTALLAELAAG